MFIFFFYFINYKAITIEGAMQMVKHAVFSSFKHFATTFQYWLLNSYFS